MLQIVKQRHRQMDKDQNITIAVGGGENERYPDQIYFKIDIGTWDVIFGNNNCR